MGFDFSQRVLDIEKRAMEMVGGRFSEIDKVSEANTKKILNAFHRHRVSDTYFNGTTGYGYNDRGREELDGICADVFGAEAGLLRINLISGTHAITAALFGALKPGQKLLYVTGTPYDTLLGVIGVTGNYHGSLKQYGIDYGEVPTTEAGLPDYAAIKIAASESAVSVVAIQRSRGYSSRKSLSCGEIAEICTCVRAVNPGATIFVDNCYGEFVEIMEPGDVGADLIAGSLIKNPGGGLAPTGGYIAGRADLVENASMRMTAPGLGGEAGATLGNNRLLYQGLFMAPHTVAQAIKTAVFCAACMDILNYKSTPCWSDVRCDIIQQIEFGNPGDLIKFCRGVQRGGPVDSFVTPEPAGMPGYESKIIMAVGGFIQGASIELSADGPMREPYAAYMQGGLTFESGKLGILSAIEEMLKS